MPEYCLCNISVSAGIAAQMNEEAPYLLLEDYYERYDSHAEHLACNGGEQSHIESIYHKPGKVDYYYANKDIKSCSALY